MIFCEFIRDSLVKNMPLEPIEEKDLDLSSKFGEVEKTEAEKANLEKVLEKPEIKIETEPAKEVISAEKDSAYNKILSKVQSQQIKNASDDEVKGDAGKVFEIQDAESQIQHLVDIAANKGVIYAVKVAKHIEDNYVLDMFHDKLLAEELHDALLKKGLIEEI